jgi:hypothetical protein
MSCKSRQRSARAMHKINTDALNATFRAKARYFSFFSTT